MYTHNFCTDSNLQLQSTPIFLFKVKSTINSTPIIFIHIQMYNCFQPLYFLFKIKSILSSIPMIFVHIQIYNYFQPPYFLFKVKSTIGSTPIFLCKFKSFMTFYIHIFCIYSNLQLLFI